jgi:hypothetical protein
LQFWTWDLRMNFFVREEWLGVVKRLGVAGQRR